MTAPRHDNAGRAPGEVGKTQHERPHHTTRETSRETVRDADVLAVLERIAVALERQADEQRDIWRLVAQCVEGFR